VIASKPYSLSIVQATSISPKQALNVAYYDQIYAVLANEAAQKMKEVSAKEGEGKTKVVVFAGEMKDKALGKKESVAPKNKFLSTCIDMFFCKQK
jgi:precorrin-2 methylase